MKARGFNCESHGKHKMCKLGGLFAKVMKNVKTWGFICKSQEKCESSRVYLQTHKKCENVKSREFIREIIKNFEMWKFRESRCINYENSLKKNLKGAIYKNHLRGLKYKTKENYRQNGRKWDL